MTSFPDPQQPGARPFGGQSDGQSEAGPIERGELVTAGGDSPDAQPEDQVETISAPAKVMRIGSMVKQLLDEVRGAPLDDASRERLGEIYERSIVELGEALSPDLQQELHNLALPFRDGVVPSDAELRIAQAQLVGWLEGLFHGIQATLFAQQLAARQQLEQMRQLPPGVAGPGGMPPQPERPGTYL
jgi:hypothetical protein